MRKAFLIMMMEFKTSIKSKGFIIMIIFAPIMFGGSGIAIKLLENRVDTSDKKIAVIDQSGILADIIIESADKRNQNEIFDPESGKKIRPSYIIETLNINSDNRQSQELQLSDRIRSGELYAYIIIGQEMLHPGIDPVSSRIAYHSKNAAMDDVRNWMERLINNELRRLRMTESGMDEQAVHDVLTWLNIEALGLASVDEATGSVREARKSSKIEAVLVPVFFGLLLYMMMLMGSISQLHTIMEEKTQRIAEVMLGSVKPFEFMMGKLMGGVSVAVTGSLVYIVGGVAVASSLGYADYIPYSTIPWFFAFLVFAIFMFGAFNAALGATCSDPKDAQSLSFPAIMPIAMSLFVMVPIVKEPLTGFATWMSLIPIFTPILMTVRLATPLGIPLWQPVVGLIGLGLSAVFFVWVGSRIFRVGILMQGQPPKISNLIKWAIRG